RWRHHRDGWHAARRLRPMRPGWTTPRATTGPAATGDGRSASFGGGLNVEFGMIVLQATQFGQQLLLGFDDVRIGVDAFHRAYDHALRLVEMADALGAARRVDHVDGFAHGDRLVRAGRLADVTVDAELVDFQRHGDDSSPAHRVLPPGRWTGTGRRGRAGRSGAAPAGTAHGHANRHGRYRTGLLGFDEHVLGAGRLHSGLHAGVVGGGADEQHAHVLHGIRRDILEHGLDH